MKMHNIVLILAITSINHITTARDIRIQIKNEYQKPITLNINSENYILNTSDVKSLKYTSVDEVVAATKVVQIKAQGAWHKGINVGFAKAAAAAKQNPTAHIIQEITILNTPTYKTHFEYNFEKLNVVAVRPQSTPVVDPIDLLINHRVDEFLDKIINDKIYGSAIALKAKIIKESQYNGTNQNMVPFAVLYRRITQVRIGEEYWVTGGFKKIKNKQDMAEKIQMIINDTFLEIVEQKGIAHPAGRVTLPSGVTREQLLPYLHTEDV